MDGAVRALTTPNSPDHAGEMEHRPSALSLSLSLSVPHSTFHCMLM